MKTQDIKNMASAYMQVLEGKANEEKKPIDKVKPSELQGTHAQRKDKDIDNDGDVDSSDEYLHNRRKAVKKAMTKEANDTQMGTITVTTDADRKKRAQAYRDKQASMKKEDTKWPVLQRIMEKAGGREDHVKGAATAEPIDSKASGAEKDFVNQHGGLDGNDSGIDGAKAAAETAKNIAASVKPGPKRPADRTEGDKKSPE
jgi:hypothetical protein